MVGELEPQVPQQGLVAQSQPRRPWWAVAPSVPMGAVEMETTMAVMATAVLEEETIQLEDLVREGTMGGEREQVVKEAMAATVAMVVAEEAAKAEVQAEQESRLA